VAAGIAKYEPYWRYVLMYEKSKALFAEAGRVIPGGVNSPVRAFKSLTHQPLFIEREKEAGSMMPTAIHTWTMSVRGAR
jgi:hypothetical protein